jgi:phage shock protein C
MVYHVSLSGKRLYRSRKQRIIAGVCGGIAEYFGIDPVLIRLAWVLFCLAGGAGVLFYIIAWIIIPPAPDYVDVQSVAPGGAQPSASTIGAPQSSYPGFFTIAMAVLGVALVVYGIFTLFSSYFSFLSVYVLPASLILLGCVIVAGVLIFMRR